MPNSHPHCSWCLKPIEAAERQKTCPHCGKGIRVCVAPGCKHYACWGTAEIGGKKKRQRHLYCAEHRHAVANFAELDAKLEGPDHYWQVYEHRSRNLSRMTSLGLITLGGAVVAGPVAAVARMGLGVASGAVLGGIAGGYVGNAYLGDISGFDIRKVQEGDGKAGKQPAIITINGFLSEPSADLDGWRTLLGDELKGRVWYHLDWEARSLAKLGNYAVSNLSAHAVRSAVTGVTSKFQGKLLAKIPSGKWSGGVAGVAAAIANPWHVTLVKADKTGVLLADILRRCVGQEFVLVGHSLGCRVAQVAMETLATAAHGDSGAASPKVIHSAKLFAAATDNDAARWQHALEASQHGATNYYCPNDNILKYLYRLGTFLRGKPAGVWPIEGVEGLLNVDVAGRVGGHMEYKYNGIGDLLRPI